MNDASQRPRAKITVHRRTARNTGAEGHRERAPGDLLIRPRAVVALVVLIVNDHVLKQRWPGLLSGKLSDLAGLVFLPLLIISVYELARAATRRPWCLDDRGVLAAPLLHAEVDDGEIGRPEDAERGGEATLAFAVAGKGAKD